MTLPSTPTVRRGSTPLPIKHQLRREEAVHDDCDWTSGGAGLSASPNSFSPALDESMMVAVEDRPDGPLKIALLGQNGVGKSSLAIALAGDMDRTASVDSDGTNCLAGITLLAFLCEQQVNKYVSHLLSLPAGEGYVRTVTVDDEESTIIIYDNWRQVSLQRSSLPTFPFPCILLVRQCLVPETKICFLLSLDCSCSLLFSFSFACHMKA